MSAFSLDFRRANAFFVDREGIRNLPREERKAYLERADRIEKLCLKRKPRGDSFWNFVEGRRNRDNGNGQILSRVKLGILNSLVESEADVFVINATIRYDFVPEGRFYPVIDWAKERKGFRWLYYASDAAAFVSAPFFRARRGKVYIAFGVPRKLSEIASGRDVERKKQLTDYVKSGILDLYDGIAEY